MRRHSPIDSDFVVANWASTFRNAYAAGMIAMEDWDAVMYPQIAKVIAREGTITMVAHDDRGPLGFISANPSDALPHVFYVYVNPGDRMRGIARALFEAVGIDPEKPFGYGCKTKWCSDLARKIPQAQWRPLVARFPKGRGR